MKRRLSITNKRRASDRRWLDRRRTRRRLGAVAVPLDRRTGEDRRNANRRRGVRRASDTLPARIKIFQRERRTRKK